jgi:hypothetical protein
MRQPLLHWCCSQHHQDRHASTQHDPQAQCRLPVRTISSSPPPTGTNAESAETASQGTPLAPSVEKAYYRKCIELKRRLNQVEAANDEAKVRRVRLDRAIMKMRLERAFLLEQLSRRMEVNVDGSEGSGDEGMATVSSSCPTQRRCEQRTRQGRRIRSETHAADIARW